jgi:hypothetical protein
VDKEEKIIIVRIIEKARVETTGADADFGLKEKRFEI